MRSICLVIVFNHRYDENIPKLRKIYQARFSTVRFLSPFYDGTDEDVIPVYESSYLFQGYFIQAYSRLTETGCDDFLFLADDMILNPDFDEQNIYQNLPVSKYDVIISAMGLLNERGNFGWIWSRRSSEPFFSSEEKIRKLLPDKSEAERRMEYFFDVKCKPEYTDAFFEGRLPGETEERHKDSIRSFITANGGTKSIPYPMAWGYADFLVISREKLYQLSYICGIFSVINVFVEIAIPTAIMLTTRRDKVYVTNTDGNGRKVYAIWDRDEKRRIEENNHLLYEELVRNWDPKWISIHPVKVSRWIV